MAELLQGDAMRAQGALRKLLKGPIKMKPQSDRSYIAEGEYFPLVALSEDFADKTTTPRRGPGRGIRFVARAGFEPATFGL